MNLSEFKFKENLGVADLDIAHELMCADLTDRSITDKLITDIFSQLSSLDLVTEIGTDFIHLEELFQTLLAPLLGSGFIELKLKYLEDKPFFVIGPVESGADRILDGGHDPVKVNNLLIDAHADVVPYSTFRNGESIIQTDSVGNEYVFGRGANDMLTQVAVAIVLLYRLYKANINPPILTISTDEELANPHQGEFYSRLHTPAAISLEPTGNLLGGVVTEILQSRTVFFKDVNTHGYSSARIDEVVREHFSRVRGFSNVTFNAHFSDDNLYISFAPYKRVKRRLKSLYNHLFAFFDDLGISTGSLYGFPPSTNFDSTLDKPVKKVVVDSVNNAYGGTMLLEDDHNMLTTALPRSRVNEYALANAFQCSLGMHSPTKARNTVILSFPERGGRHTDYEHVKIGEPSMLLESLFDIAKNLKVPDLES